MTESERIRQIDEALVEIARHKRISLAVWSQLCIRDRALFHAYQPKAAGRRRAA